MPGCLETKNLVKIYRKRIVVNRVSITVRQGEIVGILGPNGAGKTTTFHMVVGLIRADEGEIFLDNQEISRKPMYARARMGIGYLPQEPSIFAKLTVKENIEIILEYLPLSRKERQQRLETLLDEMKLLHLANSKAGNLSGGERRRLEVARSLVTSPSFLMLDEPFAAIDPKLVEGLQEAILNLKSKNIGILITDHKARETLLITDRSYIMNKGCILKHGKTSELVSDEEVRKLYLGKQFIMPEVHG
jgi:lipopolysaccharide export system ATP-binding protein